MDAVVLQLDPRRARKLPVPRLTGRLSPRSAVAAASTTPGSRRPSSESQQARQVAIVSALEAADQLRQVAVAEGCQPEGIVGDREVAAAGELDAA